MRPMKGVLVQNVQLPLRLQLVIFYIVEFE